MFLLKKRFFFIVFLCLFNFLKAHNSDDIDNVLIESKQEFNQLNFFKSIELGKEALQASKDINYSKGIATSSIYLAKAFIELGNYNKGLSLLSEAEKEPFFSKYINFQVESYRLKGRIYGYLEMYDLAVAQFYKQLHLSEKIEPLEVKRLSTLWAYQNLTHIYNKKNNNDSINKYLSLQEKSLVFFNGSHDYYNKIGTYNQIAEQRIKEGDFESAERYVTQSLELLASNKSTYFYPSLEILGKLEEAKGNIDTAGNHYKKALDNALEINDKDAISHCYKVLSDFYKEHQPNMLEGKVYYEKHKKIEDSLKLINSNILDKVYREIIKEERANNIARDNYKYYFLGSILTSAMVIGVLYKRKKRFRNLLSKKKMEADLNEQKVAKLKEALESKKYEDLIHMSKNNNPEFLNAFKELFPSEIESLKENNPNTTTSEMCFCALSYLNYSTKEIAEIQNVTIRAVQVRKNRIRKKFNIPSEIDFNIWMIENLGNI
ncbi:hypothetical protein ACFFU1_08135 [Algibacter miyuki]|uniref:HTH luxR-type domain-containing protein n=1 Tax=Algibacter miyuki TaxID=1306933 RepID=A0ABV5GYY4_9FLAO|nr:hypothetical protein [Algibacter miyuki]MDN3666938.1 hypothetical protein [Algibacter miyuki]